MIRSCGLERQGAPAAPFRREEWHARHQEVHLVGVGLPLPSRSKVWKRKSWPVTTSACATAFSITMPRLTPSRPAANARCTADSCPDTGAYTDGFMTDYGDRYLRIHAQIWEYVLAYSWKYRSLLHHWSMAFPAPVAPGTPSSAACGCPRSPRTGAGTWRAAGCGSCP